MPQDQPFQAPLHPLLQQLDRHLAGLRVVAVPWAFDTLLGYVLQQRVSYAEASRSYLELSRHQARVAPGPLSLLLPPQLEEFSLSWICSKGVDEKRASTLLRLPQLRNILEGPPQAQSAAEAMLRLRGLGPWTVQAVIGQALGDADALPTGDLHFPHLVSYKLTGVRWSTDERMLELLQPYRPSRFRALRLLLWER